MTDEQLAREWLQFRKFEFPLASEEQEILDSLVALLARRALEARNEALEEAALHVENFGMSIHQGKKCLTGQAIAESLRSLAAASKAAGGGQ